MGLMISPVYEEMVRVEKPVKRTFIQSPTGEVVKGHQPSWTLQDYLYYRRYQYPNCTVVVWEGLWQDPRRDTDPDWGKSRTQGKFTCYPPENPGQPRKPGSTTNPGQPRKTKKSKASKKIRWP